MQQRNQKKLGLWYSGPELNIMEIGPVTAWSGGPYINLLWGPWLDSYATVNIKMKNIETTDNLKWTNE